MGSVGDSHDNALAENLWMLIKTECVRGRVFTTRAEANLALRVHRRLLQQSAHPKTPTTEQANLKPRHPVLTS